MPPRPKSADANARAKRRKKGGAEPAPPLSRQEAVRKVLDAATEPRVREWVSRLLNVDPVDGTPLPEPEK